ncbi:radical SAM protein [Elusimicrobiota bacterium]
MAIIDPIIRPPAEAYSFLLQITTGCSANHCSFCGAYLNKRFRIKDIDEIQEDINEGALKYPDTRRVFLIDGDALVVQNDRLLPLLESLNRSFPMLTRISSYANGYNITNRSTNDLIELSQNKMKLIYIGLESGSEDILKRCNKRSSASQMTQAVKMAASAGIKSSVIVLLGLGGKKHSQIHVQETIKTLNIMQPNYLSFLSVMLIPGTPLYDDAIGGIFKELDSIELLQEMLDIIKGLDLDKTVFRSNHASNYLPLEGRFPRDKDRLLNTLKAAINGKIKLKPESLRGL